jgi:ubiquinone/menaquinone biosynthesis C-methylase UbiE
MADLERDPQIKDTPRQVMPNIAANGEVDDTEHNPDHSQYLNTNTLNVQRRFVPYGYARTGPSINEKVMENLRPLDGDETIVDLGCGRAENLIALRAIHGHVGRLIAIDQDDLGYVTGASISNKGLIPIDFRKENALETSVDDEEADRVMALFMLYHVPYEQALAEIERITKPGGKILVATSGKNNKPRHREFEAEIAESEKVEPPPIFSEPFDADTAASVLPERFKLIEHYHQNTDMVIVTPEEVEDYLNSLSTMASAFRPPLGGILEILNRVVASRINAEIATKGEFVDHIDRHLFTLQKPAS